MKAIWILAVAGLVRLGLADEEPSISHLPPAVQQTIRENTSGGELKKVKTRRGDAGTVYEVEFKERGDENELVIGADGSVISERTGKGGKEKGKGKDEERGRGKDKRERDEVKGTQRAAVPGSPGSQRTVSTPARQVVQYADTPGKVRQVAGQHLKEGHVEKVERAVHTDGKIVYHILFRKDSGDYQRLVVREDGTVIRNQSGAAAIEATTPGAKVLQYSEVPERVRRVAGQHLRNGHVQKVERTTQNGELIFDIHFRKDNGELQRLVLAEDGRVVSK